MNVAASTSVTSGTRSRKGSGSLPSCVLAGLFLALGYLARTPKLYQAHTVLEVDVQEPTPIRSEDMSSRMRTMFLASQEAMRTIEQNLTNRSLLARVVRAEGLAEDGGRALLGRSVVDESAKTTPTASTPASASVAREMRSPPQRPSLRWRKAWLVPFLEW